MRINNIRDTYGGTAWSVAACPRNPLLAVGCEDGAVRLFRYESDSLRGSAASSGEFGTYMENGTIAAKKQNNACGVLEYSRSMPTSGSRILCLSYHPSKKMLFAGCSDGSVRCMEEDSGRVVFRMLGDVLRGSVSTLIWSLLVLPDSTVITGDSRGQVRGNLCLKSYCVFADLSLPNCIIWQVQVWDGNAGVLMDSFRQHTADVLTLAASPDGTTVFAAGVDGKVICLQKSNVANLPSAGASSGNRSRSNSIAGSAAENTWVYVHAHRAHSHDVLALAVCQGASCGANNSGTEAPERKRVSFAGLEDAGKGASNSLVLLSGGVDTRLCTYSVDSFVRTRPTWIPPIPTNSLISTSARSDVIALRNREYVDLWGVGLQASANSAQTAVQSSGGSDSNCRLRMRLQLKGNDYLHCSALSPLGDFVAASSASGIRVYEVITSASSDASVSLRKVQLPEILQGDKEFAHAISFVQVNSTTTVADVSSSSARKSSKTKGVDKQSTTATACTTQVAIHCAKKEVVVLCECDRGAAGDDAVLKVVQVVNHRNIIQSRTGSMERVTDKALTQAVNKMVFSADGQYLAVSSCSSRSIVYVYDLSRQKLHWILPPSSNTVTDFVFRRAEGGASLVVLSADNTFRLYDIVNMKLDVWSESNAEHFPAYVKDLSAPLCGVALDPQSQDRLVLYGQGCCVHVDLSRPLTASMKAALSLDASSKLMRSSLLKKRRNKSAENGTPSKKKSTLRHSEGVNEEDLDEEGVDEEGSGAESEEQESNFVVFNKYRNLLHVGYLPNNQLVSSFRTVL